MKPPLSFVPALPAATGIVAGILLFEFTPTLFCIIAGAGCILIFFVLYFSKHHYLSFYVLSTVAGICCSAANAHFIQFVRFSVPGNHFVEARVIEDNSFSDSPSLTVEFLSVDSLPTYPFRCIVSSSRMLHQDIALHSTIKLQCHIEYFTSQTDVPFEYERARSMYNEGINLIAYPLRNDISVFPPPRLYRVINYIRNRIYNSIVNSPIDGDTAAFLLAVILGERHFLDQGTLESYRSLGVAHVLALSGLHVGVLASLFAFLIWPIRLLPHYRGIRVILLLGAVWLYTVVCGMGDSILRAAIMLSVYYLSGLLQRSYYPTNALLLAITIILSVNPSSLFSPGFQLSVAAVFSIIIFSPIVPKQLKKHPVRFFLANMLVLPIAAMLGTGLISAYHFSTFSSGFLPANIIIGIIFPYILIGGIILSIFTSIGIDFLFLGQTLDILLSSMDKIVETLVYITPSPIRSLHFSAWAFVPYSIAVGMAALSIYRRRRVAAITAAAFFIITFAIIDYSKPVIPASELYVVRRPSSCILVRSEKTAAIITLCHDYDSLSTCQIVETRCQNFLHSRGCTRLWNLKESQIDIKGFSLQDDYLYADTKKILLLNTDTLTLHPHSHTDYLFVGPSFSGDLHCAIDIIEPDSVILAADIHPSRRKRFLKEIVDHSTIIDLRHRPFSIVSTK